MQVLAGGVEAMVFDGVVVLGWMEGVGLLSVGVPMFRGVGAVRGAPVGLFLLWLLVVVVRARDPAAAVVVASNMQVLADGVSRQENDVA